ncbi:MAG: hypothetical protein ACPKOP_04160 [Sphaerochaetaceae bacterium]
MAKDKKVVSINTRPWNYDESVEIGKKLIGQLNKLSLGIVRELHAAKNALSNSGVRNDLVPNGTRLNSFEDYLNEIGLAKRTAYNWLSLYDSKEDRLLTTEEFKAIKIMEFEKLIKQLRSDYPEWRPDGWSEACEKYYRSKIQEDKFQKLAQREHFEQLDLFNRHFFQTLQAPIDSPEDILHFSELKEKLKPIAYPGIPVQKQTHAVMLIEKVIKDFPEKDRKGVAKALAEATMLIAMEEI